MLHVLCPASSEMDRQTLTTQPPSLPDAKWFQGGSNLLPNNPGEE